MITEELEKIAERNRLYFMRAHGFPDDASWIEYAITVSRRARLQNCGTIAEFLLQISKMSADVIKDALGIPPTANDNDFKRVLIEKMEDIVSKDTEVSVNILRKVILTLCAV